MEKKYKSQLSNPFSTGGGGINFEWHVQSAFVLGLIIDGYSPVINMPIDKICFQAKRYGWNTDICYYYNIYSFTRQTKLAGYLNPFARSIIAVFRMPLCTKFAQKQTRRINASRPQKSGEEDSPICFDRKMSLRVYFFYVLRNFVERIAVERAKTFCAALFYVPARKPDSGKPREPHGRDACAAILYADYVRAVDFGDVQPDRRGFRVQPRVGLGRQFAERADAAFAQSEARGNGAVVKVFGLSHAERVERRRYFRPSLFVKSARYKPYFYAEFFKLGQKLFKSGRGRKRALFASAAHYFVHFVMRVLEVQFARRLQVFVGAVFVNTVLKMLGHRVPRHKGQVGFVESEAVVAEQ